MGNNPYQTTTTDASASLSAMNTWVDGKYLVVTSGAVLPPLCVKTNTPIQPDDLQHRRLRWCPPIVGLLILLSGLLLILVYFIASKRCTITFGVSPDMLRKYRNRRIFKIIAVIILFFAVLFSAETDNTAVIIVVLALFLIAVISLFIGNSPLAIAKHHRGRFWISGCSKEFLAHIQTIM